jgi:hypothetical protein
VDEDGSHLFDVGTPLGFTVRTTRPYWRRILLKHPDLQGRDGEIRRTLETPATIRRSSRDPAVLLFYRPDGPRWLVAVARRLDGDGFLVTAYRTDTIKEGAVVWPR